MQYAEILDVKELWLEAKAPDGNVQRIFRKSLPKEFRTDALWQALQESFLTNLMGGQVS